MNNERINTLMIIARHLRELAQGGENLDNAYIWFNEQCKIHSLTSREEFKVVLLAGTMKMNLEKVPASVPWENKPGDREISPAEFERLHQQKFETARSIEEHQQITERKNKPAVSPSAKCLKDARKALGAAPYNEPGNFLVGDGYFSRDCINKYGQRQWDEACRLVLNEMKRF